MHESHLGQLLLEGNQRQSRTGQQPVNLCIRAIEHLPRQQALGALTQPRRQQQSSVRMRLHAIRLRSQTYFNLGVEQSLTQPFAQANGVEGVFGEAKNLLDEIAVEQAAHGFRSWLNRCLDMREEVAKL